MAKFKKKPVEIDAWEVSQLINDAQFNWDDLPESVIEAYNDKKIIFGDKQVYINTLEGEMVGSWEDWIIRGVAGEFYPCKPDIFEQTYDAVE